MRSLGRALAQYDPCPRMKRGPGPQRQTHWREDDVRDGGVVAVAVYQPERVAGADLPSQSPFRPPARNGQTGSLCERSHSMSATQARSPGHGPPGHSGSV